METQKFASLQSSESGIPQYSETVWENLVKWLHKKKGYKPEMITEPEPLAAINETFRILQEGVNSSITQDTPSELTAALTENVFVFSGFKEHHELVEASRLLTDSNGDIKPFNRYSKDVRTLHEDYNKNYLRAEYNFAVRNSQMAVKWKEWEETGDRYLLQYRTAGDDRVRETHAVLNGTTLPMDDPFWDKYLPPLGWNCRCTTVQVRKGKYPESDSKEAVMKGENCTASVKQQMFRFNPGKTMKVMPPKHPYYPKGCGECTMKLAFDANSVQCKACTIIQKCWGNKQKTEQARERTHYMHEMQTLLKEKITKQTREKPLNVGFTKKGNEHLYSDTFGRSKVLIKEDLRSLGDVLKYAKFIDSADLTHPRTDGIDKFYYFSGEIRKKKVRLNVARKIEKDYNNKNKTTYFLYSVNDIKQK